MKATTKALVRNRQAYREYGICNTVNRTINDMAGIGRLSNEMVNIVVELGFYSGLKAYPIGAGRVGPIDVYAAERAHGRLWSKDTEYGRRRRRVFVELLKYVERSPEFD